MTQITSVDSDIESTVAETSGDAWLDTVRSPSHLEIVQSVGAALDDKPHGDLRAAWGGADAEECLGSHLL